MDANTEDAKQTYFASAQNVAERNQYYTDRKNILDGVDLTPEMLDKARELGLHRHLEEADVRATPFPVATYDVVVCSLVDEHVPELSGLYAEARRRGASSVD